jgi:hypothetical protein
MASKGSSLPQKAERIQKAVQQLPTVAATLNAASDELGESVGKLDAVLKKFNLGVPPWVSFVDSKSDSGFYQEDIGYAKVNGKWGIAIRTVECDFSDPESSIAEWQFNDAPRLLRVNAVERIPELLDALLDSAAEMTKAIASKAGEVDAFASAMSSLIAPVGGYGTNAMLAPAGGYGIGPLRVDAPAKAMISPAGQPSKAPGRRVVEKSPPVEESNKGER